MIESVEQAPQASRALAALSAANRIDQKMLQFGNEFYDCFRVGPYTRLK